MGDGKWDKDDLVHGATERGEEVTVKFTKDGNEALLARGHVPDIQSDIDHVHVWHQKAGEPGHHDMRRTRKLFPDVKDNWTAAREAKARLISRAEQLATSTSWKQSGDEFRRLLEEWKSVGRGERSVDNAQWSQFSAARDRFNAARNAYFEQVKRENEASRREKERIISRAEALAHSSDLKAASDELKRLMDEWKRAGRAGREDEQSLWSRFEAARNRVLDRKKQEFEKRQREWASNKSAKERLVAQAESLANSSDLRSASDQMRKLGEEWKRIGPCEKADNDRLWSRFNQARTRLNDRKKQEFDKREREWASNKAAKQRLVSQMESLSHSSDFRAAKDQARTLDSQWRATGPCAKADNDQLWQQYKSAKDRLFEAAKRAGEQRRAEARQRAQDHVWRLEEQLRNVEAAIYRANENYSRALSARSPSMKNPNWMTISNNHLARQSAAREKLASLGQRKSEVIQKLMDARSRLNQL
ncbi:MULTISPECIES: DUF349 domain-containing protein [Microbacterium]|uniref:DUF349 domain-containing protein n=1 Tax=Microbacterium TaxID=33882 RepID=UPI0027804F99|nr:MULTISPECIES: DUF349 domain-containing protein [Microbacterium]MDQ1084558.1 hypothetical protein [Microbacterium sp. SORGH_AS_0344]MDQ1170164.1 hypothetical protein [Microbacterium proteolyticum]